MKKLLLILLLPAMCWLYSCNGGAGNGKLSTDLVGKIPHMQFTDTTYNFGTINQGEKVSHTFKFKNTGTVDLVISTASGSCGCTVPSYPKKSIAPGEESQIDVTFDSSGKQGVQEKTVQLVTNCIPSTKILSIVANIQPTNPIQQ